MSGPCGPAGVPRAGCNCDRCAYLRAPDNPDHIGVHIMDVLDPSNAECKCTRCDWLRGKQSLRKMIDVPAAEPGERGER